MRFSIGATAALAAAVVRAEEPAAEASSSTSVAKPTFTVRNSLNLV
jgi:calnexin